MLGSQRVDENEGVQHHMEVLERPRNDDARPPRLPIGQLRNSEKVFEFWSMDVGLDRG